MSYANGRRERVIQLFETAVVREPEERLSYLQEVCADDPEVRREVEGLLADADAETVIDAPLEDTIADLLGNDTVTPGTRLGPYRIDSLLGAGGMGEVYRATDTVLGRQVAIKMLPAAVAADPERIARFRREAKVLASLNHSNIGAIYGVEAAGNGSDSTLGLVLELVEGPTLADRIASGPLPIDETLAVARQIAEALEAAHQQGIVHRDLKPANIKVRDDGVVKVLDFGLARLDEALPLDPASGGVLDESPTITTPAMKAAGALLGTAAYMSPEQAKGKPADKRSDVWAFGCVVYEMLAGTRAFQGEDATDTLAAVVRGEANYSLLPHETPEAIRALIQGCLTRDRHRRVGDIAAALFALDNVGSLSAPAVAIARPPARTFRWRSALLVAAASLGLAALTALAVRYVTRTPLAVVTRYSVEGAGAAAFNIELVPELAVLPNGAVVYAGVGSQGSAQLFLRARDRIDPTLLVASGNAHAPFASPDGQRIAFIDVTGDPSVKAVPTAGGPAIRISSFDKFPVTGATWGDDNTIVFATTNPSTGLYRVPASGGEPEVLTTPDSARGEGDHVWPQFLPQARAVLFTIMASDKSPASSQIAVLDMQTGRKKLLTLPGASQAQYTSSGHLVYAVGSTLFAVPFDPDRLEIRGTPMPLPVEIATTRSGAAEFAIGRDGTLAYVPADANAATPRRLLWVDRRGQEDPIGAEARAYLHPRLSPDGSQIAVTIAGPESRIYAWDFARGSLKRVTFEPGSQLAPVWLDNRVIAYTTLTTGAPTPSTTLGTLFRRAVDGTGSAEEIHTGDSAPAGLIPSSARAGTILLWKTPPPSDILMLGITDRSLTPWYQTPYSERNAELSPNRRWVAFEASSPGESAQFNVYVRPFADPTARLIEISTGGGRQPAWNNDGTELFFVDSDGALDSVRFNPDTGVAGTPTQVLPARYYRGTVSSFSALRMYDVSKDGRFLMLKDAVPDRSTARASIVVTQNWLEELKQLLPSN